MLRIERATVADVNAIQALLRETWLDTYTPYLAKATLDEVTTVWHDAALLSARVQDPAIYFALARDTSDALCGLVTAQRRANDTLFIYRLYVRPDHQQQGIGTELFDATLAAFPGIRRVELQVVANNQKGFAFWQKHGFTALGTHHETVAGETIPVTKMEKQIETAP